MGDRKGKKIGDYCRDSSGGNGQMVEIGNGMNEGKSWIV